MPVETPPAFQGRKTARQGSEQRRLAILRAALRVLVRDGVRGVRHRAVATEAAVPLSATTYYFKDIHDLLADALTLFASDTVENFVDPFWSRANEWVRAFPREALGDPAQITEIANTLAEMGCNYILTQVRDHRQHLMLEHAFWYAALTDERIHGIALQHERRLLQSYVDFLEYLGVSEVELAAKSIHMTVRGLESEGLLGSPDFTPDKVRAALLRRIRAELPA
ncbi:MAG: transcriptional regulator [Moraxellaceae bacterium]|jgi:DNA-binding transcriptional regulator YbjK|nr:transcriptional regulator [Moraxellaceae bacterium]